MKQTIAWIGSINQQEDILGKLAEHYRVLLAKKEDSAISALSQGLQSEVEIIDCVKNGCWEADIIALTEEEIQEDLLGKIREVATQKIVLVLNLSGNMERGEENRFSSIRRSLPFSKIVEVIFHADEAVVSGENFQAVATAKNIVRLLGQDVRHKT